MQYNKMKIAVGFFVIILILSLGIFSYLLLDAKGAFKKRYQYYFITDSAASFSIGMPVKFSGFAIGSIDDIKLLNDGKVKISLLITEENRKWINKYTYLLLKKPLIGSPHVEVLASSGNGYLKPNSKLPIIVTDDINDLVTKFEPVVDRLLNIIKNIEIFTNDMVKKDSNINKTLKNVEVITNKLAKSDSLLTSITGDEKSTKSLINSLNEIDKILKDISNITSSLHKDIVKPTSNSIKELHSILQDVNNKLKELDPAIKSIGNSGDDIEKLKESINLTIEKTNDIMEKLDAVLEDKSVDKVELP